jgi:hypothetical protein
LFDMTLTHGGAASNDVAKHMSADGDKVRRLMLDLRKRLDKYYSLDGRNDELHIQIANKPYRLEEHGSRAVRYDTAWSQTTREGEAKQRIGELIAPFLSDNLLKGKTIFLGNGSTVYHVGLKMCAENRSYDQRFVTVNIPLAALWCESKQPPVSQVSIPEAVLDTRTSRIKTMPGPGWPLTVSIVDADGCFYDEDKKEVVLYGKDESEATNTSLFVQNTRHTVLFCLTNTKVKMGFAQNPNTGPPISPPKRGVIRVLVTNERYEIAIKAFEKDGWLIVTELDDWKPVLKKMKEGESTVPSE